MDRPDRRARVGPMRLNSADQPMSPQLPPRDYQSTSNDPVYANATAMPDAPQSASPTPEPDRQERYRDDAPHLNYIQMAFAKNADGARRLQIKDAPVRREPSETEYSTVDAIKTARLESAPQALFHAREQLSEEIRARVKEFVAPKPVGVAERIFGSKDAHGAGASADMLAHGLIAGNFAGCADALFQASADARDKTPKESYAFVDRIATALTMDALKGLTSKQTELLGLRVRNASIEKALAKVEPDRSTLAASIARDSVVRAIMAAHGAPQAAR